MDCSRRVGARLCIDTCIEVTTTAGDVTGNLVSIQLKGVDKIDWKVEGGDSSRGALSPPIKTSTALYWLNPPRKKTGPFLNATLLHLASHGLFGSQLLQRGVAVEKLTPRNSQKINCVRMPSKRSPRFVWTFSITQIWPDF